MFVNFIHRAGLLVSCVLLGWTTTIVHAESECIENQSCFDCCLTTPLPEHQFYIGPEIYHVDRKRFARNGTSRQHHFIYGVRAGYDRIKRCRIYWGADAVYASGTLCGHSGKKECIKSHYIDGNFEGRLGYTFQMKNCWLPTFVPYVGFGYLAESNKFKRPSPIIYKMRISFDYFTTGFISQIYPHPNWVLGVNFKARILFNSKCRITEDPDPEHEDAKIGVGQKVQYRVELPIMYRLNCWCDEVAISLVPFYEYRHYGDHPDFPFDFAKTTLNDYGFDIRLLYMF